MNNLRHGDWFSCLLDKARTFTLGKQIDTFSLILVGVLVMEVYANPKDSICLLVK